VIRLKMGHTDPVDQRFEVEVTVKICQTGFVEAEILTGLS
jgi:hypothetical protein